MSMWIHVMTIFDSLSILEGDIRTTSQSRILTIYIIISGTEKYLKWRTKLKTQWHLSVLLGKSIAGKL